jgi:taurine dioxygenase
MGLGRLEIRRLSYALGAEVRGVELKKPLTSATVAAIRAAWLDHLLLCFPDQHLERDELVAFAQHFGELETVGRHSADPETPHVTILSERAVNGRPWSGHKNGQVWHSDRSHGTHPTSATILSCREIPSLGGDTMYANMYMAYDSLSPAMQALIEQQSALHDSALGVRPEWAHISDLRTPEELRRSAEERSRGLPLVVQPAVRTHPETHRKALYLGDRAIRFSGMTDEESRPLLAFLNEHAVRYEFTYRHRWKVGDVVMWDNRCLMHIALCDYHLRDDVRFMYRCATIGAQTGRHLTAADA